MKLVIVHITLGFFVLKFNSNLLLSFYLEKNKTVNNSSANEKCFGGISTSNFKFHRMGEGKTFSYACGMMLCSRKQEIGYMVEHRDDHRNVQKIVT